MGNYAEAFEDVEVTKNNSEGFPPSPIILAVCSPYQQEIGNHMILDLLLEHRIGNVDTSDSKGTYCITGNCWIVLSKSYQWFCEVVNNNDS